MKRRNNYTVPPTSTKHREMVLNPITLSFAGGYEDLEAAFLDDYFKKFLNQARYSLLLGTFLYGIFGILDAVLVPEMRGEMWFIRYALFCPAALGVLLFSFSPHFKRFMQVSLAIILALAGLFIVAIIVIADSPLVSSFYYAGLIIVLIFGYTFLRLRFVWAMFAGWIVVLLYEIAAIFIINTPILILINNNFFVISANVIGMFAGYSMEYYTRKHFFLSHLLENEQEKLNIANRFIRKTFGRYISDDIVDSILESPEGLLLGGEKRAVTILISDLRGFTPLTERLKPEQIVQMLNSYFEVMVEVVLQYNGTINGIMGDALLVIFGAPLQMSDRAQRGIACAIAMQNAMKKVNEKNSMRGLPRLEMGIGLNESEVVVGNIGSTKRSKYTVVGSGVNLANRIESYAVGGQVLISESLYNEAHDVLRIDEQRDVLPKGVETQLRIYEVGGIAGRHNIALAEKDSTMLTLTQHIPVRYTVLEGKHVSQEALEGMIFRLSRMGAEIELKSPVNVMNNLKMNLEDADYMLASKNFYGKIIERLGTSNHSYVVNFTAVPPEVDSYFQAFWQYVTK